MDPKTPTSAAGNAAVTPFLHKVGAPLVWIAVGYLIATVVQRPRRSSAHA